MPHLPQSGTPMPDQGREACSAAPEVRNCPELIGSMKDAISVNGDIMSTGIVWEAEEGSVTTASAPRAPARRLSR